MGWELTCKSSPLYISYMRSSAPPYHSQCTNGIHSKNNALRIFIACSLILFNSCSRSSSLLLIFFFLLERGAGGGSMPRLLFADLESISFFTFNHSFQPNRIAYSFSFFQPPLFLSFPLYHAVQVHDSNVRRSSAHCGADVHASGRPWAALGD